MSKQLRQYLRRSLCGILSAAMILTGSIIPDISVLAAQPAVEGTTEITDADGQVNATPSVENKDAVQNPDADDSNADGDESDAVSNDSGKEDEGADVTSPDENTVPGDEENDGDSEDDDTVDGNIKDDDAMDGVADDDDAEEAPDEGKTVFAEDGVYDNVTVNLNYYVGELGTGETVGFYKWGSSITLDTAKNPLLSWKALEYNEDVYTMTSVVGHAGWYNITFTATETVKKNESSLGGFKVIKSSDSQNAVFECDAWNNPDIYIGLLDGTMTAVKDKKGYAAIEEADAAGSTEDGKYTNESVTLNYYVGGLKADDETIGFYKWSNAGGELTVDTTANPLLSWGGWGDASKNPVYQMQPVTEHTGWYTITFTVTDTLTVSSSLTGFSVFRSSSTGSQIFESSGFVNPTIYAGLLSGEMTAVKGDKGYATIEEAVRAALVELVAKAKELKQADYKAGGWKKFSDALKDAEAVLAKANPTDKEIDEAYENLNKAMKALIPNSSVQAEINVTPIALADDFITGADISSYWALKQSGTKFKDENGKELSDAEFFQYLHDGGTNWIRIRVWNDPYDSDGHGYGGGNNDLDKAKIMGKLATDAGMRVLIDFHYSDFWADPEKQQAPKAWASMSVDDRANAVYQFTKESLSALKTAGVDVGMVQVGNETTSGICGVKYATDGWAAAAKIYNAGSQAVREFDKDCLVAIHFTNPETSGKYAGLAKNLADNNVDYDVFASSYYPFWHGTTANLTSVLADVAKTYKKKVMVAETSWATTLDDQDGHDNTVRKGNNDTGNAYAFSVQGQADEISAVVEAANNVNSVEGVAAGSSIGVFYWESAWLSPYYAYNEDGTRNEELYNKNKEAWEKYGSGWAASYGGSYDAKDAGKWYGGSAVDNQAWFGFDGTALATAKVYSYIRTGAIAEKAVSDVVNPSITIKAEESFEYPAKVTVSFNDGTSAEYAVTWNAEDQAKVDTEIPGYYEVSGTVTCKYTLSDGSTNTETKNVTLTITVNPATVPELINPGFEDDVTGNWKLENADIVAKDSRNGTGTAHFYSDKAITTKVTQTVKGLDAGIYTFGGYIEGANADADAVVTIYDKNNNQKGEVQKSSCSLDGWLNWKNPEIAGIVISEGDYLVVGMEVAVAAGGWGTIDDFYLYATKYGIVLDDQNKNGTLTASADNSVAKETITITATPKTDYILTKLTISGKGVKENTLTSSNGTVSYDAETKKAVLTYNGKVTGETTESFIMPKGMVKVSAVFRTDVDVAALDQLIAKYEKIKFDGYTEESWKTFEDALTAAKAASENVDATQTEIDSAKEALEAAYQGLTKAPAATEEEIAELSALIEEYEKVTSDGYTEESWNSFTDALAAAKAAVEKEDATTTDIARAKQALETAYNGLEKSPAASQEEIAELSALIEEYEKVTNDGYTEESWKIFEDALATAKTMAGREGVTKADIARAKAALEKAYAGLVREGLRAEWTDEWAELLGDDNTITYTGKAIKPTVKVYDGETLLTNKSYSVTYKNNTKAGGEASVIIKGKGNYTGSFTMKFNIGYVDLAEDSDVSIADLYVAASKNGKPVSVKPVVTWKGKKVDAKKYTVELPEKAEEGAAVIPYVDPGTYDVVVKAKDKNGIYSGERTIKITLVDTAQDANVLMSAVKVKFNFKSKKWTEDGVTLESKDIKVTYKQKDLTFDTDYELTYENNDRIGTATVIITGTGKYVGELRKTFKITGTAINAKAVKLDTSAPMVYNGKEYEPEVTVTGLTEGKDYEVTYQNNTNAGKKATAVITGINAYSGTVKKTFKIAAYDVTQADVSVEVTDKEVVYAKGGSKPPVEVTFKGEPLVQGKDYTVSYAKNTKATEGATAEVKITGKGNFTKNKTVKFAIGKQSLGKLKATAADQTSAKKWNKVSPVITDLNGKALKKGTDYEKKFTYTLYNTDDTVVTDTKTTPPAAGMRVEVTATGKGSYEGTITAEYRIIDSKKSIASARIKVKDSPIYTGEAIELEKSNITLEVKDGKKWMELADEEYEIVGYSNNINKGKAAKVTIHGLAPYGGTKTFKFEIKAQSMEGMTWAERIASMFEMMFN